MWFLVENYSQKREALSKILADIERKEFVTEALVTDNSPLIGQTIKNIPISSTVGVRLLDVVRNGKNLNISLTETKLLSNDRLILSCKPQGLIDVRQMEGFEFFDKADHGVEQISSSQAIMVEAMIKPTSGLLSQTLEEADFRGRFNLTVVALHRRGKNLKQRLNQLKLDPGDTLLLLGTENSVEKLRGSQEVVLLDKPPLLVNKKPLKALLSVGVLLAIITTASLGVMPLSAIALSGAGFLIISNTINLREAIAR